jgi:hypothetical protein
MGGGVRKDAKAAREPLDGVEQQGGAVGPAGCNFGNAADLVAGIRALDPSQPVELVDELDELAQTFVQSDPSQCSPFARISRAACGEARFLAIVDHPKDRQGNTSWPSFATSHSSFPIRRRPPSFSKMPST